MLPWYTQEYWPVCMDLDLRIIHSRDSRARAARLAAKIRAETGVKARLERGTHGQFDVVMDGETIALRERAFLKRLFGEEWHFPSRRDLLFGRGSFLERLFGKRWGLFEAAVVGAVKRRLDARRFASRTRLAQEMRLTLEIIPGRAIGPFRLGMTFQEIEDTLRSLHSEPVTLDDLGIVASCSERPEETPAPSDRCDGLEIQCIANVLLLGQRVNEITLEDLYDLLRVQHRCKVHCDLYWGHLETDAGISATKWEPDDLFMYSITVTAPKPFPPLKKKFWDFSADRSVSRLREESVVGNSYEYQGPIQSTVKLPGNRHWSGTAWRVAFTISGDEISSISWEGGHWVLEKVYPEAKRILGELGFSVHDLEGWYQRVRGGKKDTPFSIRDEAGNPEIHVAVRGYRKIDSLKEWRQRFWAVLVDVAWKGKRSRRSPPLIWGVRPRGDS